MDFERLDAILKERHISRRKLALSVGIKEGTMSTAYRRRSGLSSEDVLKIAEYLGVSPYYLEGWTDFEQTSNLSADESFRVMGEDLEALARLSYYDERNKNRVRLNTAYDKLNTTGQTEAVKRVEELTEIPRYTAPEEE